MPRLSDAALMSRIKRHNALHLCMGIVWIPVSVALWIGSFYLFRWLFGFGLWGLENSGVPLGAPAGTIAYYVAIGATILLAIDGFRYRGELFNLLEYARSGYREHWLLESRSIRTLNAYNHNPLGMAYMISQALFCAPRSTVQIIRSFGLRLPTQTDTVNHAARILEALRQSRQWEPVERYQDFHRSLSLLVRMRLIWLQEQHGDWTVRYPAGED
ncbi:MAG: hypothetical protein K8T25_04420 [Planctomycetia bacterium]|nr:hypothetical protein [Planctomycetia bacterium]